MSDVVNLRMARKAKRRSDADTQAAANRLRHGRTLGERTEQSMETERARRVLDGARRIGDTDHGG